MITMPVSNSIRVEVVQDPAHLMALAGPWRSLMERTQAKSIYLTWEWISLYWQHFGGDKELRILCALEGKRIVGLAPMELGVVRVFNSKLPYLKWRVMQMIGGDFPCEHLCFVAEEGSEAAVTRAFLEWLSEHRAEWDVLIMAGMCESSPSIELLQQGPIPWDKQLPLMAPYIPIRGGWEDHLAIMSKIQRKSQRRWLRQFDEAHKGRWSFETCRTHEEVDDTLHHLMAWHQAHWEARDETGAFGDPRRRDFLIAAAHTFLDQGWLRLWRLVLDGQLILGNFTYAYGGRVYDFAWGMDPEKRDLNIGHVSNHLMLKAAFEAGEKEYDFLWGDEPYKFHWRARPRYHNSYTWFSSPWGQALGGTIRTVRRIRGTDKLPPLPDHVLESLGQLPEVEPIEEAS